MNKTGTISILKNYIKFIFPMVDEELAVWRKKASNCPDSILSYQAAASIDKKSFHAIGGSVFALYPMVNDVSLVKLIVAYQTISDYLDNLCDRAGVYDETAFSCLHLSMTDALDPSGSIHDYYRYYPYKDDGGYLAELIKECRLKILKLPSYSLVKEDVINFARIYSSLQAYKHLSPGVREKVLLNWANSHIQGYPCLTPWEFCAAAGSTLGIFMLFAEASNPASSSIQVKKIKEAYFPWVCGLHILLDYFIDYYEDIENNDLNFIQYYKDDDEIQKRLRLFIDSSLHSVSSLKHPDFHSTVILGLLAMYLSDDKAYSGNIKDIAKHLIKHGGIKLNLMHRLCRKLRKNNII